MLKLKGKKQLHATVIIMFACTLSHFSQDIHFSQFYMCPQFINPASAGAFKDINANTNYREQWRSVANPYKTFTLAYDMKVFKDKFANSFFGAGLSFFNDRQGNGNLTNNQASLSIASHLKISKHQTLSVGIQGGFGQRSFNLSALTWDSQFDGLYYDASLPTNEQFASTSFLYADVNAGVLFQYKKNEMYISGNDDIQANIGFSVSHVNRPRFTFYSASNDLLYMKYVAHGNILVGIKNTPISFIPGFIFYRQGPAQEISLGTMIRYSLSENSKYTNYIKAGSISCGTYYRFKDALVIVSLLEFANYSIGMSYDINTSDLTKASYGRGGFEIALRYFFPYKVMLSE